jgi:hypothetical protein
MAGLTAAGVAELAHHHMAFPRSTVERQLVWLIHWPTAEEDAVINPICRNDGGEIKAMQPTRDVVPSC